MKRNTQESQSSSADPDQGTALHCLADVARRLGIDTAYDVLRRNYALPAEEPKAPLLIAIARDLGLEAKSIRVSFKDLPRLQRSLPAILRTTSGACLVLEGTRMDPKVGPVVFVRDATMPDGAAVPVDQAKLRTLWQGEVILVKRRFTATDEEQPFGVAWLMGQVIRERSLFIDVGVAALVSTVFAITPAFVFRIVVDRVLFNHSMSTLEVLSGALLLLIAFETVLTYLRRHMIEVATSRIDGRLNLFLVERLLKLPIDYFERHPTGQIMSTIGRLWQVRNFMTGQLFGSFLDTVPLIGLVPVMFVLDWRLTLMVLALAGIVFIIVMSAVKPLQRRYAKVVKAEQRRGAHLVETIYGMRTIKALAIEGRRRREWDVRVADMVSARFDLGATANYPHTFSLPFERMIFSGSFCVGAFMALTNPDSLSAGVLGAFAMLSMRLGAPLVTIARMQLDLQEMRGTLAELSELLNTPPEDGREQTGMRPQIKGEFVFKDVSFRYRPESPYALERVSFRIPAGTVLGIMGRSGSGKTTVTRLLQRLATNYEGLIKLDGADLREINLAHLRANVGVVLQENFLFSGTVRENIGIARPEATLDQIARAAQLAGAEEFIERMPRGYETMLEEGASNLSGGQRQRLAIARALLTDPPVLLLDEATSALDAESESIINANLRRIAQGRTVITISHRLSMLVDADAILVMDAGKVYDMGTHDELLQRCDIYKQMWHQQNRHAERTAKNPTLAIGRTS